MLDSSLLGADRRDDVARSLDARIERLIAAPSVDDAEFDAIAVDVFAYQYERDDPYRRYCDRFGASPAMVRSWRDVPPVPTTAFSAARLACFSPERTAIRFESSGTTGVTPSTHELENASLYDASLRAHYAACVLAAGDPLPLIALVPPFEESPNSSLSYMVSRLAADAEDSTFLIRGGELDVDRAVAAFRSAQAPVVVFGTAFAFVHLFDRVRATGARFALPVGSRVVETGGFKGRSREVPREQLYGAFESLLGVPRSYCVSEYGMCELGSQWYDANIADIAAGRAPRFDVKIGPHWARARVVDPVTADPVAQGEDGLIQIFDLSNRGSVASILTGDLGVARDGGIVLLGRHRGAPPKGCSIAADALLDRG